MNNPEQRQRGSNKKTNEEENDRQALDDYANDPSTSTELSESSTSSNLQVRQTPVKDSDALAIASNAEGGGVIVSPTSNKAAHEETTATASVTAAPGDSELPTNVEISLYEDWSHLTQEDVHSELESVRNVPQQQDSSSSSSSPCALRKRTQLPSSASLKRKLSFFPTKLHQMLSDPDMKDAISWLPHGRAWKIHDQKKLEELALNKYFPHCKIASFMRLVNGWNFQRVKSGPDENAYYHELFLRGLEHISLMMRRNTEKKPKNFSRMSLVPDFYELSENYPLPHEAGQCSNRPTETLRLLEQDTANASSPQHPQLGVTSQSHQEAPAQSQSALRATHMETSNQDTASVFPSEAGKYSNLLGATAIRHDLRNLRPTQHIQHGGTAQSNYESIAQFHSSTGPASTNRNIGTAHHQSAVNNPNPSHLNIAQANMTSSNQVPHSPSNLTGTSANGSLENIQFDPRQHCNTTVPDTVTSSERHDQSGETSQQEGRFAQNPAAAPLQGIYFYYAAVPIINTSPDQVPFGHNIRVGQSAAATEASTRYSSTEPQQHPHSNQVFHNPDIITSAEPTSDGGLQQHKQDDETATSSQNHVADPQQNTSTNSEHHSPALPGMLSRQPTQEALHQPMQEQSESTNDLNRAASWPLLPPGTTQLNSGAPPSSSLRMPTNANDGAFIPPNMRQPSVLLNLSAVPQHQAGASSLNLPRIRCITLPIVSLARQTHPFTPLLMALPHNPGLLRRLADPDQIENQTANESNDEQLNRNSSSSRSLNFPSS